MREMLPQEAIQTALAELDKQVDKVALQRQVESIMQNTSPSNSIIYMEPDEVHRFWSNNVDNGTFENNHQCWSFFDPVS